MFMKKLLRLEGLIIVVGAFVALTATAGAMLFIARLRDNALAQIESNLQNLSLILAEQTDRAFQAVEVTQQNLMDRMIGLGVRSEDDLRRATLTFDIHTLLKQRETALPQVEALEIVDSEGRLLNSSRSWPPPPTDVSDCEYFKTLKTTPALNVGEAVVSRGTGICALTMAQRIVSPEGRFVGVVAGVLNLDHFKQLYRDIVLPPGSTISLRRKDGILLARHPRPEPTIEVPLLQPDSAVPEQGILREISPHDGEERIVAVKALQYYPATLSVGETVATFMSGWRREAISVAGIALLMDLAIAAAGLLGVRQIRASARLAEAESYRARHDLLTGLPNRIRFGEEIERAMIRDKRFGEGFAILLLDLDRFKQINDTLGYSLGDNLIRDVAARLRSCVRETDLIARIGGDEFAIVQKPVGDLSETPALAAKLLDVIAQPYDLGGDQVVIGVSIGAALVPAGETDPDGLLRQVDLALQNAKQDGRGIFRLYEPEMEAKRLARHAFERDLRQALEDGEFELVYQPILDLRTNRLAGFEALVRWRHATRGLVSPNEFIPVAEETGLIGTLGRWILQQACREAVGWPAPLKVSVNVSPVEFRLGGVLTSITQVLASSGLPAHRLGLEITESVLLEDRNALDALHRIRALGVSVSLDDFGTGYASMSYLRRYPFDRIKIDQSFVQEIHRSSDSTAIVHAILDLAQRLGMMTTAEGVECEEQLNILRSAGCTEAQGYWIAKPLPAHEIDSFLSRSGTPTSEPGDQSARA